MARDRLIVVWRVTEECDLGCRFCAYSRHLPRPRRSADPEGVLAFGRLLAEYAAASRRSVLVSWMGGEPLLWTPLRRVTRGFRRLGLETALTTHGAALADEGTRRWILEDLAEVTVSVDGVGPAHDALRDAPGLYDRVCTGLEALAREKATLGRGPLLRINTLLTRDNVRSLGGLCRAMAELGVEEVTLNALGGRERADFAPEHSLRPEDAAWLRRELPGIRERAHRLGLAVCGSRAYLEHLGRLASGSPLPPPDCRPGQEYLFIDAGGRVGPCAYTTEAYGVPLEEIRTPGDLSGLPERFAGARRQGIVDACCQCAGVQLGKFGRE